MQVKQVYLWFEAGSKAWFDALTAALISFGFTRTKSDHSLFVHHSHTSTMYVLVYVDDIILTGNNSHALTSFISLLNSRFALKDLGPLHYFLGIQVDKLQDDTLLLRHSKYITDLLHRVNMASAKPQPTPMTPSTKLLKDGTNLSDDPKLYRSVVGDLQYTCITRPDLAFSVNKVSQFMQAPLNDHWKAVKRILRYLQGTSHLGLHLTPSNNYCIFALCDADWAAGINDRRSTSGFCVYFGRNLISWQSKKQPVVSRSSTEAEYRSLALVVAEVSWLRGLLNELVISQCPEPPIIFCDNMSAVLLVANPVLHSRTKHIELDIYYVR